MAPMLDKYAQWIAAYEAEQQGILLGQCKNAVDKMAVAFPELRKVPGHVEVLDYGRRAHWWLVTDTGVIVDPTRNQFPLIMSYEPWDPSKLVRVGKCMECGKVLWDKVPSLDCAMPHYACCAECDKKLSLISDSYAVEEPAARCKHNLTECSKCGLGRNDVVHTTIGGKGVVGRVGA